MVKQQVVSVEVAAVMDRWSPTGCVDVDSEMLGRLVNIAREWVTAAQPGDVNRARLLLWSTFGLLEWARRFLGTTDAKVVLDPSNIEYWTMVASRGRSAPWRESARGALRMVGAAVNPDWPPSPLKVGRRVICAPYTAGEETAFVRTARLVGFSSRATRMWIVGASLGAGLSGPELTAANSSDLVEIADGRLAVQVRGRNARLVPIRHRYTDLVWEAIGDTPDGRFIPGQVRNRVYHIVYRLNPTDGESFSLRRGRSTWLLSHVVAGTPLHIVQHVAGSLSGNTLTELLQYTKHILDDDTAAVGALRA